MTEVDFQPTWFSRPSESIKSAMAARNLSLREANAIAGTSAKEFSELYLGTSPINRSNADILATIFGIDPDFWMIRQEQYDEMVRRVAAAIEPETGHIWLRTFPKRELESNGWIRETTARRDTLEQLIKFFDVLGPQGWESKYAEYLRSVNFRSSETFQNKIGALTAWLRRAELEADLISTNDWSVDALKKILPELRKLTTKKSSANFLGALRDMCAACGVAVVFLKAPQGCRASGATRMMDDGRAMIALSFRYLSNDHFWFTFFHEIAHLILHQGSLTLFDGEVNEASQEREANEYAARLLIPEWAFEEMQGIGANKARIISFARKIGIAPGIVVGQMQHYGTIKREQMNFLKRRYDWDDLENTVSSL
jgi:HTH-type transcriptional regulator / antitoxin HigA